MPPLIRRIWVAMDEQQRALFRLRGGRRIDIVDSDFSGIIYKDTAMVPVLVVNVGRVQRGHYDGKFRIPIRNSKTFYSYNG